MIYKDENTDSQFLSVIKTWPEYFNTMDEGLGTTYERFILHRFFNWINIKYNIDSVLEVPSFGMTGISGINSLWWAQQGKRTVIIDTDKERISKSTKVWNDIPLKSDFIFTDDLYKLPFHDQEFDVSWNFASIWFVEDLEQFSLELSRITKKIIFICIPNRHGIGFILRKIFAEKPFKTIYLDNIKAKNIINNFSLHNFSLVKNGYLDIPPWPDIAMKKEDMFKKIGLGFLLNKKMDQTTFEKKCIVDHFSGKNPNLKEEILNYSFLEKAPFPVKQLWGHHRYFIFVRENDN